MLVGGLVLRYQGDRIWNELCWLTNLLDEISKTPNSERTDELVRFLLTKQLMVEVSEHS